LVGIGRSISGTITLSQAAPAGGLIVNLTSADPSIATVTPATFTIPANTAIASFTVNGIVVGNTSISASSSGFATVSTNVGVTSNLISLGTIPTVAPTQSLSFPVSLANNATGDTTITFTSSDPSIATVTPSIVIPNGLRVPTSNPQVTGVGIGTVQITAS